jgi:hypothetical protein
MLLIVVTHDAASPAATTDILTELQNHPRAEKLPNQGCYGLGMSFEEVPTVEQVGFRFRHFASVSPGSEERVVLALYHEHGRQRLA